ncbi:hypothetical protein H8356DRAFT_999970 [Neocallimastix lanati (nom. inval.)]|nr:hypothetical protein H8356DRAFT_999970 [Neocallimastix sp. JGI-2020a]
MDVEVTSSHNVNTNNTSVHSLKFMSNDIISINEYGKAIHDYSGRAEDELTFEEEDVIYLSLKDETGDWVFGELNGSRGWFPSSNIRVLSEKECINEGINWPPQSSFISSASSFSIKSSQKDISLNNIGKRCNSRDSFSSLNSSNHVIIPTSNEDTSNPILPNSQVRSWYSKYQQIKRYQPKRGLNSKIGGAMNNTPIAASNQSERSNSMSDAERRAELTSLILSSNNSTLSKEQSELSSQISIENEDKHNDNNNNNNNNDGNNKDGNNNNNKDEKNVKISKECSTESFNNEKFINEVASLLNSDNLSSQNINLDDKVLKEENDCSIDNLNINNATGSIQDLQRRNINNTNKNINAVESNKPIIVSGISSSQLSSHSSLSINVKDINGDSKKVHHSGKLSGSGGTPTRVIHRVTTPTLSRQKWSDFVSGSTMQNLTKKEIQRQEVMFEMIITEKDYLKDLGIVMDIYIKPMREMKIIRPKDIDVIFSDWENILKVHEEIMKRLDDRQKQGYIINEIGDIWIIMSDYLKVYTMYCSNHPYALIKLQSLSRNKNFTKFLESRLQLPESRNLNLANFLLKPVQRICKYPLLLREIIKNTEEDHPDYKNLVSALCKIETVITIINDAARQTEGVHKLLELQQRFTTKVNIVTNLRTIVHKSEIDIIEKRLNAFDKKKRQMYLLNDMVLLARSTSSVPDPLNTGKLKLIAMISTKEILVKDLEDTSILKNAFELVHTGKQSYKIAVDTPMNKEVWLKMLNNVILNDVQSNKVDSITAMKPSVETTYKSLNGKNKKKNLSPKTPDYRLATLKFNDTSMIKEVENEFNRINKTLDFDEGNNNKDDEKSVSSEDNEEKTLYSSTFHNSNNEMPSISEGVVSNFDDINSKNPSKSNEYIISNPIMEERRDSEEKEDISATISISESESKFSAKEDEDEEDEDKNSPFGDNEDIFNLPICHDSQSIDFEGLKDQLLDDDYINDSKKKRYSFPLSGIQSRNINITDLFGKEKIENPIIPDNKISTPSMISDIKENNEDDNLSVSIKSSNDSVHKSGEETSQIKMEEEKTDDNITKTTSEVETEEEQDKSVIITLNDMIDDIKIVKVEESKEGEEELEDEVLPDNKFTRKMKSCDSIENIKKLKEQEYDLLTPHNEYINDKSNESVIIPNSNSNGSFVINNEKDEEESSDKYSFNNSNENISTSDNEKRKSTDSREEDFSFSKLRSMFGNMSNRSFYNDMNSKVSDEENDAKREELKNIILPSKIHNLPTPKRGFIINTLIEDNKNGQSINSPTRLIYDISKNPFIIKDISSNKSNKDINKISNINNNLKLPKQNGVVSVSSDTISGNKVSSIQKGFISKTNDEINNSVNKHKNELNNHNLTGNVENKKKSFKNDTLVKSPLIKEIQFDDDNNNMNDKQNKTKDNNKSSTKSVKFGSAITVETSGSNVNNVISPSMCVSSKKFKSPLYNTPSPLLSNSSSSSINSNSISSIVSSSTAPTTSSSAATSTITSTTNTASLLSNEVTNNSITNSGMPLTSKDMISSSTNNSLKKGQISNINKPVNDAKIVDVENVSFESSKKYVYIIEVDRGNSDISIIHHTYDDFFDLHLQLIGNFPEEAGVSIGFNKNNNGKISRRIIPDLPAQMMFVSEAIARSRITRLQEYINTILKLPGKISKHPLVMNFFKADGKWSASVYSNKK